MNIFELSSVQQLSYLQPETIPKIRFKGFTDDWEQRKLSNIVDVCSGRDYKHLNDGDIPVYGTGGYMLSVSEALSEKDDAIGIGRKGTIDNPFILRAPFWTVDTLFYCVPKDNYDLNFTYCVFQNINWKSKDESTGVPSLSKTTINNIEVMTPTPAEQKKIGDYFTALDNLITLHQRKLDNLKNIKKSMLQKLFPKKGEKYPEVRFKGFNGDWEQRELGDVFKEYSEKNHLKLPPLTIIQGKGTILREESDRNLQYDKANLAGYKLVRKNDLIVHLRSFEGGLERANTDGIVSPAYHMFHGDNTDTRFYYPFFRSKRFIDSLLKPHVYGIRDGKSIDIEGMKTIIIPVPSYEEQRRIGDFIESMDNLITLHQRKLDNLNNIKKGFLQQMFA